MDSGLTNLKSESIFDKFTNYITDAVSYPKYKSYQGIVDRMYHIDGNYKIYLNDIVKFVLLKNNPQFVKIYGLLRKRRNQLFECVIRYPFTTLELINITDPPIINTIDYVEAVITSSCVYSEINDDICEIILKYDKNRYIGSNGNYEKYQKMIGLRCIVSWNYKINYEYKYVYDINVCPSE